MGGRGGGLVFFFQAEDGIRDLVRSRGLGDVYKRQHQNSPIGLAFRQNWGCGLHRGWSLPRFAPRQSCPCLLYTSDAADERSSVDLGGRRIIKQKIYFCSRSSSYVFQNI